MKTINFAALIITHGRPNSIFTDATLRRQGYTGEIFYVVDDEDETGVDYVKKYGTENVLFFCKKEFFCIKELLPNVLFISILIKVCSFH